MTATKQLKVGQTVNVQSTSGHNFVGQVTELGSRVNEGHTFWMRVQKCDGVPVEQMYQKGYSKHGSYPVPIPVHVSELR